jgi:hypothetical protein
MAGVKLVQGLEAELRAVVLTLSGNGSEHQPEVVAWVEAVHDLAGEPPRAFGEHRW